MKSLEIITCAMLPYAAVAVDAAQPRLNKQQTHASDEQNKRESKHERARVGDGPPVLLHLKFYYIFIILNSNIRMSGDNNNFSAPFDLKQYLQFNTANQDNE